MSLSLNRSAGVPNTALCAMNWPATAEQQHLIRACSSLCSLLSAHTDTHARARTWCKIKNKNKTKKMRKLSVCSWWAYSLDYALYGSVPLTSKGQENRGREGKERRRGQGFCVSGPESSFSNEAQAAMQGSFVRQLCVCVCLLLCVGLCARLTDLPNKKIK